MRLFRHLRTWYSLRKLFRENRKVGARLEAQDAQDTTSQP